MGGSIGMALRRRRLAREVVGVSRRAATAARAVKLGAVDRAVTTLARGVRDADIVVLAAPVDAIVPMGLRAAALMKPGSVLTDVGSTKAAIVRAFERRLPSRVPFVGAHPLAGSERRGLEAADARLYDGSVCILTPTPRTDRAALRRVERFWRALKTRVVRMSPPEHDRVLAACSHLPHALAYALMLATPSLPLPHLPRSFLDMTRIAKSDPGLWSGILLGNPELAAAMQRFDRQWTRLRAALGGQSLAVVRRLLSRAQANRLALDA